MSQQMINSRFQRHATFRPRHVHSIAEMCIRSVKQKQAKYIFAKGEQYEGINNIYSGKLLDMLSLAVFELFLLTWNQYCIIKS
jgi:hypothetical protein